MLSPSEVLVISHSEALALSKDDDTCGLMRRAAALRDQGFGDRITYSRKVFIPLTHLCRDSCHYCTFAQPPRRGQQIYMSPEDVLATARQGEAFGCTEALFTLGDKPELRYRQAKQALRALGYETTLDYLRAMAALVLKETSLLPHLNPGVMTAAEMATLRPVAASMGLMLEESSERLLVRGGAHFGSPDKVPAVRLATIAAAGALNIPFTSGVLVGIGETRRERVETLLALRDLHAAQGHVQEIIVQPFRAKPGTRMAAHPDAPADELLWTIAVARIVFGPEMSIQTPPNLAPDLIGEVIDAGINDWGGISPVTADYVNPEAPWPHIAALAERMRQRGRMLVQRLPLYPRYGCDLDRWADPGLHRNLFSVADSEFMARDSAWASGDPTPPAEDSVARPSIRQYSDLNSILDRASNGTALTPAEIVRLFAARDDEFHAVCHAADELRAKASGGVVRYVVNRNINYTNLCSYHCAFCAFSKGKTTAHLRGPAYDLDAAEIGRRVREARARGATEVCMQGGIHPDYTGDTYLGVLRAVKNAVADMHVHAFSPLEVRQGAQTLGFSVADFLKRLRDAGLGSLPGTAAEILDDTVRAIICPDKLRTGEWLEIVETAHRVGLKTTATIMYGHVERPDHWARHLLAIRRLQEKSNGFTEFVPLPFVHMEAPIYYKGRARRGPTWREAVLMHAVARLALHPVLPNIQVSWVKMGVEGAKACLRAGANDLGGTLMNESISRAAGAAHGQELPPESMDAIIASLGRRAEQRTTLYKRVPEEQRSASYACAPLSPVIQTPATRHAQLGGRHSAPTCDWSIR
jgi:FO synthase